MKNEFVEDGHLDGGMNQINYFHNNTNKLKIYLIRLKLRHVL